MEVFRIDEQKWTPLCKECKNILKFKINHDNFIVESECKNDTFLIIHLKNFSEILNELLLSKICFAIYAIQITKKIVICVKHVIYYFVKNV
jgi:hypothetical protein